MKIDMEPIQFFFFLDEWECIRWSIQEASEFDQVHLIGWKWIQSTLFPTVWIRQCRSAILSVARHSMVDRTIRGRTWNKWVTYLLLGDRVSHSCISLVLSDEMGLGKTLQVGWTSRKGSVEGRLFRPFLSCCMSAKSRITDLAWSSVLCLSYKTGREN